jgi:diguanylate cyclase (GGDEF)-like protein/putative nucleotidyltransferase with HDIG domain
MSRHAKLYIIATLLAGGTALATGLVPWHSDDVIRFICFLLISTLASGFKVHLPGIHGTMSANSFFILICISTLNLPETLSIACAGTVLQCVWRSKSRPQLVKVLFNVANIALSVTSTYYTYHLGVSARLGTKLPLILLLAAGVYFLMNTIPVAAIIALTEGKRLSKTWSECYFWSFPYYLVGAAIAGLLRLVSWETAVLVFPILYLVYRSYRLYLSRLDAEKEHVREEREHIGEMDALHLRTIKALALAIEAKDCTTYEHLRRVGVYAMEIGKELGVGQTDLQALQAASLLHDIGKLAVPEHIISKPGRLTPFEFEKMKTHPQIGADILAQIEFPYPVVPIVKSHHEKWDGSGYPLGLKEKDIPVGARILAIVDCFDALTSDRQYRRAMSIEDALAYMVEQSGKSFDPEIVEILVRRHRELEDLVRAEPLQDKRLSKYLMSAGGHTPATGFETGERRDSAANPDFLSSIAAARQEAQVLFELTHELGNSLSLDETLSVLALRLKPMCPYDCIAIYVLRDNVLVPEYISGENFQLFASLRIQVGEGLSGWVAQNVRPIVNGNPSVEPGYVTDPARFTPLQSALAVPLEGLNGMLGVLTLYSLRREAFTSDHLRILSAVTTKIALSIENALKYRQAETCATTDALTDLPNARSLFLQLDSELARSKRESMPVSVLVCDLDGFKEVNDRFGHLEGNRVLRRVAQALREGCRQYDYVARMGGDEFVVVLPGCPRELVRERIRLLEDLVGRAGRDVVGENILSISIGESSYPADGADAEQLLAAGDRRMYKVKREQKALLALASLSNATQLVDLSRRDSSEYRLSGSRYN